MTFEKLNIKEFDWFDEGEKMIDWDDMKFILSIILGIILFISFMFGLMILTSNAVAKANCRMLDNNGHNTHLETYWYIGKDCYVNGVPYDRFVGNKEIK